MTERINGIVLTGPTGAIGMALIQKCIEQGIRVLAICHRGSKRSCHIPAHPLVRIAEADMEEYGTFPVDTNLTYDIFYHLAWRGTFGAARNDMLLQTENIRDTVEAVSLARRLGCTCFVGAGSQAEYGRVEGKLSGELPAFPESGYGMAKLCAGQMSRQVCSEKGIRHVWVRILSVYGPYDGENTMVMSTLRKMLRHEDTAFTKAQQLWDYLYSEDAARAMLRAGEMGRNGRIYCLGSGQARPLSYYIEAMQKITGTYGKVGIGELPYAQGQVMHLCADLEALSQDTGFTPAVSFEEGIEKTVGWLRKDEENQCYDSLL